MIQTTPTINTRLADLPTTISAYTLLDENGEYTIFINSRMSSDRQRQAYEHEMRHINNEDFEKQDVEKIELEAHQLQVPAAPEQNPRPAWVEAHLRRLRKEHEEIQRELERYENIMGPYRILWSEELMLEHQRLGNE